MSKGKHRQGKHRLRTFHIGYGPKCVWPGQVYWNAAIQRWCRATFTGSERI